MYLERRKNRNEKSSNAMRNKKNPDLFGIFFEIIAYFRKNVLNVAEIVFVVGGFRVFLNLALDIVHIRFELFSDEWKIDDRCKNPTDDGDDECSPYERSDSAGYARNEIREYHFPRRSDILHKFLNACRFYGMNEIFKVFLFTWSEFFFDLMQCVVSHFRDDFEIFFCIGLGSGC